MSILEYKLAKSQSISSKWWFHWWFFRPRIWNEGQRQDIGIVTPKWLLIFKRNSRERYKEGSFIERFSNALNRTQAARNTSRVNETHFKMIPWLKSCLIHLPVSVTSQNPGGGSTLPSRNKTKNKTKLKKKKKKEEKTESNNQPLPMNQLFGHLNLNDGRKHHFISQISFRLHRCKWLIATRNVKGLKMPGRNILTTYQRYKTRETGSRFAFEKYGKIKHGQ